MLLSLLLLLTMTRRVVRRRLLLLPRDATITSSCQQQGGEDNQEGLSSSSSSSDDVATSSGDEDQGGGAQRGRRALDSNNNSGCYYEEDGSGNSCTSSAAAAGLAAERGINQWGNHEELSTNSWWEDPSLVGADYRAISKAEAVLSSYFGDHKTVEHALSELIVRRTFRNKMSKQALKDSYQFALGALPEEIKRNVPSFEKAIKAFETKAIKLRHIGIPLSSIIVVSMFGIR